MTERPSSRLALAIPLILGIAAVGYGTLQASRLGWITDDAYISFRYADHLVHGQGLVFNVGERVEGYSNFLWTLWCALGIRLGYAPEAWARFWSLSCFATTLALLSFVTISRTRWSPKPALPVAALIAAVHRDWHIFANCGLETSLFCLLGVGGYVLLIGPEPGRRRLAIAGALFGLAALTRPDGILWAVVGGGFVLWTGRPRLSATLAYAASVGVLWLPYMAWKFWYYGDVFPNTYYAKSAYLAWYSQGWIYLELYFIRYWPLLLGLPLALWGLVSKRESKLTEKAAPGDAFVLRRAGAPPALLEGREARRTWVHATVLAGALALSYSWFVARVGGDFMYARLLIPATPFFAILLELGLERLTPRWPVVRVALATLAVIAVARSSYPFTGQGWVHGIVNEYEFYNAEDRAATRRTGEELGRLFHGLPIRMAFTGGQAILAYYSKAPLAIETATGLTDHFIAHQKIAARTRIGHEKVPPFLYLISQRQAHFWMYTGTRLSDSLATYIPLVPVELAGMRVMVLSWDPPVMEALRRRGARVDDFPLVLDRYLNGMAASSDEEVRMVYEKSRRFYFDHVRDPVREAPFLARLDRGLHSPNAPPGRP